MPAYSCLILGAHPMKTKFAALALLLFIVLIIVAADSGHLPGFVEAVYAFPNGDRLGHVSLYGILAFLLARAFPRRFRVGRLLCPISVATLLVFSGAEEWSQALFPTRTADPVDLVCSCLGIFLGTWAACRRGKTAQGT